MTKFVEKIFRTKTDVKSLCDSYVDQKEINKKITSYYDVTEKKKDQTKSKTKK